ncbi:hypothetical protein OD91_0671 [Lutibacter sp. Hel_I_33_5]|uniref:esterase-like activity of phytase family protein n=1 Tax=Lutibacter sp. Hel_I_33_5 TaxID=1566289 RepID=UPI0011A573F9|nr:esterase-like activity of phytase family protein [Lutibacter sp. Hel_I_33_5]TVZ55423.1 hypothetical protein OD91_0671 [Lutibacter sp. Hel_I_33_5]
MKINQVLLLFLLVFFNCNSEKSIQLNFLDEYIIKDSINFNNSIVGGLSGVDYANNQYYFVVDDASKPRVLLADINIRKDTISGITFKKNIHLNDSTEQFYEDNHLDLESIFVDVNNHINLTSEGSIKRDKNPTIFKIDASGKFIGHTKIPNYFNANSVFKPKHNGVFEGSTKSLDASGFWVAMESPLEADGEEPTFHKTQSPVRITFYDAKTNKATKQFAYLLDKIDKPAKGSLNLNGLTAILEYAKNQFFIIERAYQSGYGSHGNVVRIYKSTLKKTTTTTLEFNSLRDQEYVPIEKELVLDFSTIQDKLTDGIIDNIEGITLGPKLSNGNQSLLLISDDNFQIYGKQLNQFILLEILRK